MENKIFILYSTDFRNFYILLIRHIIYNNLIKLIFFNVLN